MKGPRRWAEERLGEDFWLGERRIGKENAKTGRTGESSGRGRGFSEGAGLLSEGAGLLSARTDVSQVGRLEEE